MLLIDIGVFKWFTFYCNIRGLKFNIYSLLVGTNFKLIITTAKVLLTTGAAVLRPEKSVIHNLLSASSHSYRSKIASESLLQRREINHFSFFSPSEVRCRMIPFPCRAPAVVKLTPNPLFQIFQVASRA